MSSKTTKSEQDYERLGRLLVELYESGYQNKKQLLKLTFLKGLVGGLGGVVGATIVVGLLVWLLSLFNNVPLVGHFVDTIRHTIDSHRALQQ